MTPFDPINVRKAVDEFTPSRPRKFRELITAKEVIAELRRKRASYRAISELLTKHCLPTSKTAVAGFCHEILEEIVRPRKRPGRKAKHVRDAVGVLVSAAPRTVEPPKSSSDTVSQQPRIRGPRIASIRPSKATST